MFIHMARMSQYIIKLSSEKKGFKKQSLVLFKKKKKGPQCPWQLSLADK